MYELIFIILQNGKLKSTEAFWYNKGYWAKPAPSQIKDRANAKGRGSERGQYRQSIFFINPHLEKQTQPNSEDDTSTQWIELRFNKRKIYWKPWIWTGFNKSRKIN